MRQRFPGFYRPTSREFSDLWQQAVFVPDANVLLKLYMYPKQACDDLLGLFTMLRDRIWIPHQVALEYQVNRLDVIAEQVGKFVKVRDAIQESQDALVAKIDELKLRQRHSAINPAEFLATIDATVKGYLKDLAGQEKRQLKVSDHDAVRDRLDELFEGKVGERPQSQEFLDEIYAEGARRYERKQPPGYLDTAKGADAHIFDGLVFKTRFGDLILWKQLLVEAKNRNWHHVVFITDDDSEDWWWRKSGKTMGPRPELVQEIISASGTEQFYMYSTEGFMKYAGEFLKAAVQPESIQQVHQITAEERAAGEAMRSAAGVEQSVLDWAISATSGAESVVAVEARGFDFLLKNYETGRSIGYVIKVAPNAALAAERLRRWLSYVALRRKAAKVREAKLVVVLREHPSEEELRNLGMRAAPESSPVVRLLVGVCHYVGAKRLFKPLLLGPSVGDQP